MDRIDSLGQFKFRIAWGAAAVFILLFPGSTARGDNVPFGPQNIITGGPGLTVGADSVVAFDMDGDGDVDVISGGGTQVTWYENDGATTPSFLRHTISVSVLGPVTVFTADLDGDGDPDVLSSSERDGRIAWYENTGGVPLIFIERTIMISKFSQESIFAIDLDGDLDIDIITGSCGGGNVVWYENDGLTPPSFTLRSVAGSLSCIEAVFAFDLDNDQDADVLSASSTGQLTWFENNGMRPPSFTIRSISSQAFGAEDIFVADVNGDGLPDILSFAGGSILWFENGGGTPPSFTQRDIPTSGFGSGPIFAVDLDFDEDTDILAASEYDEAVAWYENDGMSPPSFTERIIQTDVGEPNSIFVADLNGDQDLDVLVASHDPKAILWFSNGGGQPPSFSEQEVDSAFFGPEIIFTTDFNGDGKLDVFSAGLNTLLLHSNLGGEPPSFGIFPVFITDGDIEDARAADLDNDGDPDLLATNEVDDVGQLIWFSNQGGGAVIPQIIPTTYQGVNSVATGDLDLDGDLDVLASFSEGGAIAWYENDGMIPPSFTERSFNTGVIGAEAVSTVDLDGDGDLDALSVLNADGRVVAWYENDGMIPPSFTTRVISFSLFAETVLAADLDGDGDSDIVVLTREGFGSPPLVWLENNGMKPPSFIERTISLEGHELEEALFAIDLDGDGDVDVLTGGEFDDMDSVVWFDNDGMSPPSFTRRTIVSEPFVIGVEGVWAADLDGDGDVDVLSTSSGNAIVAWYENLTERSPAEFPEQEVVAPMADGAASVFSADLDGDGDFDILSASAGDDTIAWYESNVSTLRSVVFASGQALTRGPIEITFTTHIVTDEAIGAKSVFASDLDQDGNIDILSASTEDDKISWYKSDGAEVPTFTEIVITTSADGAKSVFASDLDKDGDIDVLSASELDNEITWYRSDGADSPSFEPLTISSSAMGAQAVFAIDLDGDGDTDVLSASSDDDKIAWYKNDGSASPTFVEVVISTSADGATSVFAVDLDSDGDIDVLSASSEDDKIAWYVNDGLPDPTFTEVVITTSADGAKSVFAADVDSDGDIDVIIASANDDKVAIFVNDGLDPPSFKELVVTAAADGSTSVFAIDIDGDGDIDILSASELGGEITWYENIAETIKASVLEFWSRLR